MLTSKLAKKVKYRLKKLKVVRPYEALYNKLIYKAKRKGIAACLTYDEFCTLTSITECVYCAAKVEWCRYNPSKGGKSSRYNLDRKINSKSIGYTLNNLVVCCAECNLTRGDRFTHEEFLLIGEVIKKINLSRQFALV